MTAGRADQILNVSLEAPMAVRRNPEIEHERQVALYDLMEENSFQLAEGPEGPYNLHITAVEGRVILGVQDPAGAPLQNISLPLSPFRKMIKDYHAVCDSYYDAIRTQTPQQIEALERNRRALHDEGADRLKERLCEKIQLDGNTTRRLFTLLCVLQARA
ncbi:MAG: UPF0262 family protein [Magnetospiraceae bacterium]